MNIYVFDIIKYEWNKPIDFMLDCHYDRKRKDNVIVVQNDQNNNLSINPNLDHDSHITH